LLKLCPADSGINATYSWLRPKDRKSRRQFADIGNKAHVLLAHLAVLSMLEQAGRVGKPEMFSLWEYSGFQEALFSLTVVNLIQGRNLVWLD
jgi:hypothetical protein